MVQVASALSLNAELRSGVKRRATAAHQTSTLRKLYVRARSNVRVGVRSLVDWQIQITSCSHVQQCDAFADLRSRYRASKDRITIANAACDESAASRENSSESQSRLVAAGGVLSITTRGVLPLCHRRV